EYGGTSFFENLVAHGLSLSQFFLLLIGQGMYLHTVHGAAIVHGGGTGVTLDEQQVAGLIGTVDMGVTGSAALVAMGDDIIGNPLPPAVVEHKVLAHEFVLELLGLYLSGI